MGCESEPHLERLNIRQCALLFPYRRKVSRVSLPMSRSCFAPLSSLPLLCLRTGSTSRKNFRHGFLGRILPACCAQSESQHTSRQTSMAPCCGITQNFGPELLGCTSAQMEIISEHLQSNSSVNWRLPTVSLRS